VLCCHIPYAAACQVRQYRSYAFQFNTLSTFTFACEAVC
jgi:hypothetical protein